MTLYYKSEDGVLNVNVHLYKNGVMYETILIEW